MVNITGRTTVNTAEAAAAGKIIHRVSMTWSIDVKHVEIKTKHVIFLNVKRIFNNVRKR